MRRKFNTAVGLAVALLAPLTLMSLSGAAPPADLGTAPCTITVEKPVPVQVEPVVALASHTAALEGPLSATVPEESGISVVSVAHEPATAQTLRLTLRTAQAKAGQWELTIVGAAGGECSGKIEVKNEQGPTH